MIPNSGNKEGKRELEFSEWDSVLKDILRDSKWATSIYPTFLKSLPAHHVTIYYPI